MIILYRRKSVGDAGAVQISDFFGLFLNAAPLDGLYLYFTVSGIFFETILAFLWGKPEYHKNK